MGHVTNGPWHDGKGSPFEGGHPGNGAHAKKAAEIIDAWSRTLKTVTNHDAKLLIGMVGHKYCNAAELLKHTWDGWPEENPRQFQSMLREVWYCFRADIGV